MRFPQLLLLSVAAYPCATTAQIAGHYQGTNSDGGTVDVYVTSSNGSLILSQADDSDTIYCKTVNGGGWTVTYFGNLPITGDTATISSLTQTIYYGSTLTFKGDSVSGKVQFALPEFIALPTPPKTACASISKNTKFTAKLISPDTRPPHAIGVIAVPVK